MFLDSTVVNVALPAIQATSAAGSPLQQWVVDAYLLTLGSLILVGGSLGDLYGEQRVFAIGTASFGVDIARCAPWRPRRRSLIIGRALQGISGALLTPAALATITADVQRRGARRRDRPLDGVDRDLVRDRAARRRLAHRARLVALDLLDQRARS